MTITRKNRDTPSGTQAVVRALKLLKTINRSADPISLDELASVHGLSKSTAYRMLSALTTERMAKQDPETRLFSPGPESFAAGVQSVAQFDIRSVARPILTKMSALAGETATLEIRIENEMLILDEVHGNSLVGARPEIGTRWPMYATSSGKAVLASLPDSELHTYLALPRERLTEKTVVDDQKLRRQLKKGLIDRFWLSIEELQPAFSAVSTVISDHNGVILGTVSIGGLANRLSRNRLSELGVLLVAEVHRL
ncbi:MAG: IclR family transcriptional regulator [Bacteroidetes bacterium]|nr:MAG: IclR family transcriptional regulator [Bacteroidota bacterium]